MTGLEFVGGTRSAGLLSDLARGYEDDQFLLVGHASSMLMAPLHEQAEAMAATGADCCLLCSRDGTPSGLMLIRCGCLRDINPVGFVDLNEQALPMIAKTHDVRVLRVDHPVTRSVRTRSSYIQTLRELNGPDACADAVALIRRMPDRPEPLTWASALSVSTRHHRLDYMREWTLFFRDSYRQARRMAVSAASGPRSAGLNRPAVNH